MNFLEKILETKKEEIKKLKKIYSINSFYDFDFFKKPALKLKKNTGMRRALSIIAEIKKGSPSKGIIRNDFNHLKIAEVYIKNSVDAISILTDKNYFKGDINYLNDIAKIKKVPLLRKDFIIEELQVFESKANGADIILLISEALSKGQINNLTKVAKEIGLDVLLELHSEKEMAKIDFDQNKFIGINNRNLENFTVSLNTTKRVSQMLPNDTFLVSESGISDKGSIDFIKGTRANCVLAGEYFMVAESIEKSISEFKKWCRNEG